MDVISNSVHVLLVWYRHCYAILRETTKMERTLQRRIAREIIYHSLCCIP